MAVDAFVDKEKKLLRYLEAVRDLRESREARIVHERVVELGMDPIGLGMLWRPADNNGGERVKPKRMRDPGGSTWKRTPLEVSVPLLTESLPEQGASAREVAAMHNMKQGTAKNVLDAAVNRGRATKEWKVYKGKWQHVYSIKRPSLSEPAPETEPVTVSSS